MPNKAARYFAGRKRSAIHFHRGHIPSSKRGARRSDPRVGRGTTTDWKISTRVETIMMPPSRSSIVRILSPLYSLFPTTGFQNIVVNVMKLLLDIPNLFGHRTQFQFRFDVHLVVQVRLDAVFGSLPVLADQDKNGKASLPHDCAKLPALFVIHCREERYLCKKLCCIGTHTINPSSLFFILC